MRLALIAPFALHPKGTTRWRVLPLARALAADGHQVLVAIPPYDSPADGGKRWRTGGVEVVNVAVPGLGAAGSALPLAARLVQAALRWRPDVVHVFKPKGYSGLAACWLAQRGVAVVQDTDDWEEGWNDGAGYPAAWRRFFAWQERAGLRSATAVTAASRWLHGLAAGLRGSVERVFYLPNGVGNETRIPGSYSRYATPWPNTPGIAVTKRTLLYTRFAETTPETVWRVWSAVLRTAPEARLLAAGRGGAGEEQELHRLALAGGAPHALSLLGWVPATTLPGLLAAVDAALFPVDDAPRNSAKSPMRLLDALAAGVPLATQAVGEYGAYVVDGETGLLAPPGDDRALAAAVARLLTDRDLAARLGREAARRTAAEHSWPRLATTTLAAYRAALDARR